MDARRKNCEESVFKNTQKEEGLLESQERDGWTWWDWYEENGCQEAWQK